MRLADYLRSDLVLYGLEAADTNATIEALVAHLAARGAVVDGGEVTRALLERERLHNTVLGHGIAIPHTTLPSLDATVLLVAVAPDEIQFGPPGTDPCRVFFTLLSPEDREAEHIKLLARISRLARQAGFVESLCGAGSDQGLLEVIRSVDAQHV